MKKERGNKNKGIILAVLIVGAIFVFSNLDTISGNQPRNVGSGPRTFETSGDLDAANNIESVGAEDILNLEELVEGDSLNLVEEESCADLLKRCKRLANNCLDMKDTCDTIAGQCDIICSWPNCLPFLSCPSCTICEQLVSDCDVNFKWCIKQAMACLKELLECRAEKAQAPSIEIEID